jgi:hypothetical protein
LALVSWCPAFNSGKPSCRLDRNDNDLDVITTGYSVESHMVAMLLASCYLYTGQCRVEEINPPAQSWEECDNRRAVLLKTLRNTISDDGWTPVGISCSLQKAPTS